ncbi:MAG: hypothetical protein ABII00_12580 [Elusimicrobiota bacterium]
MKRTLLACAAAVLLAAPAVAQRVAAPRPAPSFVPGFLGSMVLSLQNEPFFASLLINSLDSQLARATSMSHPREAAGYLRDEIEGAGKERRPMAARAATLGKEPLEAEKASAILIANALVRPISSRRS